MRVRVSFGQRAEKTTTYSVRLEGASVAVEVSALRGVELEADDRIGERVTLHAGGGDVDALDATVTWTKPTAKPRQIHSMWQYLLQHGTPEQVRRLEDDPGLKPDAPVLTVELAADGTRGFSIGLEQLARHRAMWLPEHEAFITLADQPVDFAHHLASLKGERTLDRVKHEPEATDAQFKALWEDFGNPSQWKVGWQTQWLGTRGHLVVTAAEHGSLYKFAVDRWASVRPDFASPHKFRFDPLWPNCTWTGQRIVDGLPVIITSYEREGQRCELEQFAAPLTAALPTKRGEVASVFFTRMKFSGRAGPLRIGFRLASQSKERLLELKQLGDQWAVVDGETGAIWLIIEPGRGLAVESGKVIDDEKDPRVEFACVGELPDGETREVLLKLASPVVSVDDLTKLGALDFATSRAATVKYWEEWLAQGARFEVPERAVNDLFRANLWHALILPRHRTGDDGEPRIDLPYANTAYGQRNADWPINQGVYVDYMLYGLRGYYAVAEEEFFAMFQTQQKPDGRIGGFAEWGVYSPGHLYAIAQNYLLSHDRASFDRLLPQSLKTLDWCLAQIAEANVADGATGLIKAPLNDLTHAEREWAFPQSYFVAGLATFSRALALHGDVRAEEVRRVAGKMKQDVEREFARASVKSPVVQLGDGTWQNYVPSDAMTPRRRLEEWYPTDVDCGPLHLARLGAIDPRGPLANAMLDDHEDNLFLKNQGAANEPVYLPQVNAHLLRDEPEAAIRGFYSMMACAFSHHQLEPLEHRWAWGQYYGPPSTDGAWFEVYRNLLIHERDDDVLLLAQATPRAWLEDGKRISVQRAPTYYGPLSFTVESRVSAGEITTNVELSDRNKPAALLVRFRHPQAKRIQSASVNGQNWNDFDVEKEWLRIARPTEPRYVITTRY